MEHNNKNELNEVDFAQISTEELEAIQTLENKLGDQYYILAFEKKK